MLSTLRGWKRIQRSACFVFALLLLLGACNEALAQKKPRAGRKQQETQRAFPNVVIFMIDSLRADRLGAYGYTERPVSPRIDELARESVLFENAYAPAPWTLPSVVSIMTGLFPCEHGTLDSRFVMSEHLKPIAEKLRGSQYRTVSLYANPYSGPDYNLQRGYDVLQSVPFANGQRVAALFDEYLREPFFLFVHNIEPHTPHTYARGPAPEGFRQISKERRLEIRDNYFAYRKLTRADFAAEQTLGTTDNTEEQQARMKTLTEMRDDYNELYCIAVHKADERLGEVVDELKQRGVWDNTLFILLSDHGEEMNEHGGWLHDQSVYEELIHVPLLIKFPRGTFGGKRISEAVSLIDVVPTLFQYLGQAKLGRSPSGVSLMPLIREEEASPPSDFRVISMRFNTNKYFKPWKQTRGDVNIVVRHKNWKGIWNVEPDTFELYDLAADPREQKNLSAENQALTLSMRLIAKDFWEKARDAEIDVPKRDKTLGKQTEESLEELGYQE